MSLYLLPFAAAAAGLLTADSPPAGTSDSQNLLYGTIVTAIVTLVLGLAGIFVTRARPVSLKPVAVVDDARPRPRKTPEELEIEDLKKVRDATQRRVEWQNEYIINLRDAVRRLGEDPTLCKPEGEP